jgi:hypothetical protein
MLTRKAFLSCAIAAAAVLLAAPVARATDPPMSCQTTFGDALWAIEVTAGPCKVACSQAGSTSPMTCNPSGACTGIEYRVTGSLGSPDHLATLVQGGGIRAGNGNQIYAPCVGDPVTKIGLYSCHEQAIKINPESDVNRFKLVVNGDKEPILTSIVAKKGYQKGACKIAGLGSAAEPATAGACVPNCGGFDPFQTITRSEVLTFKPAASNPCSVRFDYDSTTGDVVHAELTDDSGHCDLLVSDVENLEITLDGHFLGHGTFGDVKFLSSGSNSCTTRVIGGRVYSWGDPCPE